MAKLSHKKHDGNRRIALRVTPAAERALRQGHPWLFDRAITQQSHAGAPGDLAVVFDRRRRFVAIGLYDPDSPIRVKVLQHGRPTPIDDVWLAARFRQALAHRQALHDDATTTGYRLVHGENDGLPSLVLDRYDTTLVLKLYSLAWLPHLSAITDAIMKAVGELFSPERIVLRLSRSIVAKVSDGWGLLDGDLLTGSPLVDQLLFHENGLHFAVDVVAGHKTGFFLDQRDNRRLVGDLAAEKRVLNVFAYTGGFSLYAARGGAASVLSLDSSAPALAAAVENFRLNQDLPGVNRATHETLRGDAFSELPALAKTGRRFDLVILDPPAFAQRQADIERALAAYRRLLRSALPLVAANGLLLAASCSSRVSAEAFYEVMHRAAHAAFRPIQEIERTGQPLDHPATFPEGYYLKALIARVP